MKLFLTSTMGGSYTDNGKRYPCPFLKENGFTDMLLERCPMNASVLLLASDPSNYEMNDSMKEIFAQAFEMSGFSIAKVECWDHRNATEMSKAFLSYDMLVLTGGHVPTQNSFFHSINLKELIKTYSGIVVGISAGSMNCCNIVYAQPELESEIKDPYYKRYLDGLHLVPFSILPHFQTIRFEKLNQMRILEDICIPDSMNRPFYALADGSFIYVHHNKSTLYGEAYLFDNGYYNKACDINQSRQLY